MTRKNELLCYYTGITLLLHGKTQVSLHGVHDQTTNLNTLSLF